MTNKSTKKKPRAEKTTMRASLRGLESDALKDYLKHWCGGLTIDETLRQALDMWLDRGGRTNLAAITAKYKTRRETQDGFVQEELL